MPIQLHLVSIFPEIFESFLRTSLVGKAVEAGLLGVSLCDPRQHTEDRHHSVDDTPFGGGDGMVMKVDPLVAALEAIDASIPRAAHRVLLTPQGEPLRQRHLVELSRLPQVALVCGRYEGFDERVRLFVHRELSLGDFVLNGGEVAAMAVLDGVARLIPGVIGKQGSLVEESHADGLLEYPHYTRPRSFRGHQVPEELVGGDHEAIRRWRRRERLSRTRSRRPDLWASFQPTAEDLALTASDPEPIAELAARTYIALLHHPVYDRNREIVTTAITNLDIHDIARSSCTYGLAGYYVVTPLSSQRELAGRIVEHWRTGHGASYNKRRAEALALLDVASSLEDVRDRILEREGRRPLTVVTSAVARPEQLGKAELLARVPDGTPLLLLLGTGWGLTEEFVAGADLALAPVRGRPDYNHLSVRSAAAILLDRLFGLRD
jgi:tRNA (guanine37-N1)-methyltransferase